MKKITLFVLSMFLVVSFCVLFSIGFRFPIVEASENTAAVKNTAVTTNGEEITDEGALENTPELAAEVQETVIVPDYGTKIKELTDQYIQLEQAIKTLEQRIAAGRARQEQLKGGIEVLKSLQKEDD